MDTRPQGQAGSSPAPQSIASESLYRLVSGDEVEVRLTYAPEYNERALIRPDGYFSLPLLGEVKMAGETIQTLTSRLQEAYGKILTKPQLTIQVRSYADRKVFVGGEVGRPGILALTGTKSVLEAVVESGGLRESASRGVVTVVRRGPDGNPKQFQVAFKDDRSGKLPQASAFLLEPLDVVIVSESGISKANRGVEQYIRRMIPVLLTGGFTYLFGPTTTFVGR